VFDVLTQPKRILCGGERTELMWRQTRLVLTIIAVVAALPVLIPVAFLAHARDQRRMREAASRTACKRCGAMLGMPSQDRADAAWAAHVAKLFADHPPLRFRLKRDVWAICAVCGATYGYDDERRVFVPIPE